MTTLALILALGAPAIAQETGAPSASGTPEAGAQFGTVDELMAATGLDGTVGTRGYAAAGDGAGMTYFVQPSNASGPLGDLAVPTADGEWAVPTGFAAQPSTRPEAAAVENEISRAMTFANAGSSLVQDADRPSPLETDEIVRSTQTGPYPITSSSLVAMILKGWDYTHTTYAADANTCAGTWVDFGRTPDSELRHAHELARWFYVNGDLWLAADNAADNAGGGYQRGDILFFSRQSPEGSGTTGDDFANVYDTAIYLGDGKVIHSRGAGAGVVVESLPESLRRDLSLIARPQWRSAPVATGWPSALSAGPAASETPTAGAPGATATDPASARAGETAAPSSAPGSRNSAVVVDDRDPGAGASTASDDVIVAANGSAGHRRSGLLASTGAGCGLILLTAVLLGAGMLLKARRRSGEREA